MKRILSLLLAVLVLLLAVSACTGNKNNDPDTNSPLPDSTPSDGGSAPGVNRPILTGDASELVTQLRSSYSDSEQYTYAEPLYNLPKDFQFVLKGGFLARDGWLTGLSMMDVVQIFISPNFTSSDAMFFDYEYDTDNGTLTLSPGTPAFDLEEALYGYIQDSSRRYSYWGNSSKYYLVRYIDLETGETLDKPVVTLFTVKADLDAPQIKYTTDKNGGGVFYWDPVPGAASYIIGSTSTLNGEVRGDYFSQVDVVSEPKWDRLANAVRRYGNEYSWDTDAPDWYKASALYQNEDYDTRLYSDEGFLVVAVNADGNSNISNVIDYSEIFPKTPYRPEMEVYEYAESGSLVMRDTVEALMVPNVESAPLYQSVVMMDESCKQFLINYPESTAGIDKYTDQYGNTYDRIITSTHGTLFMNGIIIEDTGGRSMTEVLQYLKQREIDAGKTGFSEGDIPVNDVPSVDADFGNNNSEVVIDGENAARIPETPLPDDLELFNVYANSPLSAYLAICMLNRVEEIPLAEFPEAADGAVLVEAFYEAYFQNNGYIGGVEWPSAAYDFATRTLYLSYVLTADEQKSLQREVSTKADEIVAKIIKSGMSDYEKEEAINNYLCANAEYDWAALEDMMTMPSNQAISPKYKYSQTAYGVLLNGKGICQSYAEAFCVLADKAALPSVMVVGLLNGMGGHAWNRVLIEGQWFTLDVTNNDSDMFYNEYFNMPDEIAVLFVTEWGIHVLGRELPRLIAYEYGYDYYSKNEKGVRMYELEDYLADNLTKGAVIEVVIIDILYASQEDLIEALQGAANRARVNFTPRLALWVLRIECG